MKARLERWGFACLMFSLVVLAYVANLVPEPSPPGRHRAPGRATRAGNRALAKEREQAAMNRHHFEELNRPRIWDGNMIQHRMTVGMAWMDEFDQPPMPQRRFRALAPRALAASAISAREALRRDQEAIAGDFSRAVARLTKDQEVS